MHITDSNNEIPHWLDYLCLNASHLLKGNPKVQRRNPRPAEALGASLGQQAQAIVVIVVVLRCVVRRRRSRAQQESAAHQQRRWDPPDDAQTQPPSHDAVWSERVDLNERKFRASTARYTIRVGICTIAVRRTATRVQNKNDSSCLQRKAVAQPDSAPLEACRLWWGGGVISARETRQSAAVLGGVRWYAGDSESWCHDDARVSGMSCCDRHTETWRIKPQTKDSSQTKYHPGFFVIFFRFFFFWNEMKPKPFRIDKHDRKAESYTRTP